jgi:hypothetical protein
MPLQSHIKGANVFHPMQGTLSDVLGLPTMENNGNEYGGEVGGDDFADWPPSDEETSRINFGSINMPLTLLTTPAPTPHSDVPALTRLATPFPPSYPAMPVLSAIHKQKFSALTASGSPFSSISTSPSSTPGPSAKRCHISKMLPDHDPEDIAMGERMDNFTEAFRVATGTASTGVEVSPIHKRHAIRSAQELEVDLSDTDLTALVDLFHTDVSAVDTYMELKRDSLRKVWITNQLSRI